MFDLTVKRILLDMLQGIIITIKLCVIRPKAEHRIVFKLLIFRSFIFIFASYDFPNKYVFPEIK